MWCPSPTLRFANTGQTSWWHVDIVEKRGLQLPAKLGLQLARHLNGGNNCYPM